MRYVELTPFEKIYIFFRCRRDVKKGKFSDLKVEEHTRDVYSTNIQSTSLVAKDTDNTFSDDRYRSGVLEKVVDKNKVISPFIIIELSQLIAKKNQILAKKCCMYKYKTNSSATYHRIKRFPNAIAAIDSAVRELEGNIGCLDAGYTAFIAELQEKYDSNIANKAYQLAKANVRAAHTKREQLRREKQTVYEQIIFLLSEKIRLIHIVNARIDAIRDWKLLRIRYYYGLACNREHRFPIYVYSEKDLSEICRESLWGDYSGILIGAEGKYKEIMGSISCPNEITIKESEEMSDDADKNEPG